MVKYFKRYNESDSHWDSLREKLQEKEYSVISCLTEVLNSMKGCVTDIETDLGRRETTRKAPVVSPMGGGRGQQSARLWPRTAGAGLEMSTWLRQCGAGVSSDRPGMKAESVRDDGPGPRWEDQPG